MNQTVYQKTTKKTTDSIIEQPLAPARPGGRIVPIDDIQLSFGDTHSAFVSKARDASRAGIEAELAASEARHKAQIDNKYKSFNSLSKANKIEILKNPHLNPYKLDSAYDGLANSMERWKTVAADASAKNYSPEQKANIAKNYYEVMIAPLYAKLGIAPMGAEKWGKAAYGQALEYNIESAYNSSVVHGLLHGWDAGTAALAQAGATVVDVLGEGLKTGAFLHPENAGPWFATAFIGKENQPIAKTLREDTAKIPLVNRVSNILHKTDDRMQFSAEMYPNRDWIGASTSFISEQAAQLPLYAVMGGGTKTLEEGFNLTKALSGTKLGKFVYGSLMAGGEGLAYGTLTREQEDKGQAWRDAAGFMIFHGLFNIGGMGLKKLIDVMPEGKSLDALKRRQDKLELVSKGQRMATGEERYTAHKKEVANNLAVVGIPGQRAIYAEALKHVKDMEGRGWTKAQIREHERKLLETDPARFSPVFSAASYIRSLLGTNRLSTLKEGSPEEHTLAAKLAQLIVDAGSEMNQHVDVLKQSIAGEAAKSAAEPAAKDALEVYRAKVIKQVTDAGAINMLKPEQIEEAARKLYIEDSEKAAQLAEKNLNENSEQQVKNIEAKLKKESYKISDLPKTTSKPAIRTRSTYSEDKFGQPSASYSVNADYKVYLKNIAKEKGMNFNSKEFSKYLSDHFTDLSDEDFNKDLENYFYPKALKDAGIHFEGANTIEGKQNPNFLAFMYNYVDKMPKELGQEVEQRFANTLKVQQFMNGRMPSEPQLMYYAKAMYNHVDNLLSSGRWPNESNIFRSSQPNMWQPSKWQRQLLIERSVEERKNLKDAFGSNKKAANAALATHKILSQNRLAEFDAASRKLSSQEKIQSINEEITDLLTSTGDRERIEF